MAKPEVRAPVRFELPPDKIAEIGSFFSTLLPYGEQAKAKHLPPTAHNVFSQLELSRKYRLGGALIDSARKENIEVVDKSIQKNCAIPVYITVGTSKWYDGSNHEENIAGLSELLMFEQLRHLDQRVKSVYKPGLRIDLLCEDATNKWLYGLINDRQLVDQNNMRYIASLDAFAAKARVNMDLDVRIRKESEVLREMGIVRESDYFSLYEQNQERFYQFIKKSKALEGQFLGAGTEWNDALWVRYVAEILPLIPEHQELAMLGWTGGIHPKVREYYIKQFLKSATVPLADEDWYLAAYFAGIHARRQLAISVWSPGEVPLKIAFLRYPDGSQKEKQNALQISQHPLEGHGSSHQHISPWASITGVSRTQNGSYTLTVLPVRSEERKKTKGSIVLEYAGMCVPVPVFQKQPESHI